VELPPSSEEDMEITPEKAEPEKIVDLSYAPKPQFTGENYEEELKEEVPNLYEIG